MLKILKFSFILLIVFAIVIPANAQKVLKNRTLDGTTQVTGALNFVSGLGSFNLGGGTSLNLIGTGTGTFTTTVEHDTVLISGALNTDSYLLTPKGTAADPQDVLFAEPKADTLIVHRPASGTSGLVYFYWRFK